VLLEDFEIYSYLQGENLLNSKANYDINFYRVSNEVNSPKNNNANLITMVETK
jgi:putative SOS response-associated peptidase YedK